MRYEADKSGNLILKDLHGHFHVIGDVHGCFDELLTLLKKLGYKIEDDKATGKYRVAAPEGCMAVFVGDLVDRGPNSPEVLRLVMDMVEQELALCVSGNHDDKLFRKLMGRNVQVRHGLELTMAQLENYNQAFISRVREFLGNLPHHIILDEGRLVVAHAGLEERLHGRHSKSVRDLCLYGPTTGEVDAYGLPVRLDWAADYSGVAVVVYGHTPVREPRWKNNTINIDTGCVFGGKLTALTYPDHILTTVDAFDTYAESIRPFLHHPTH
ncbi:metallophosphoesterase [Pontibacter virosus]|uniref:Calcineurin-like phosphoesterase family protein n=1 Tax=Pontibacter virosus TaxID=1765052 RepID=A0A2U1AWF9_9BACT|nr:metallophosphoesterase [Pontibacter virosus]PVY40740.1 calcineurin-like phosphoesterase family protein [Pontibacter virosus]